MKACFVPVFHQLSMFARLRVDPMLLLYERQDTPFPANVSMADHRTEPPVSIHAVGHKFVPQKLRPKLVTLILTRQLGWSSVKAINVAVTIPKN